MFSLLPLFQGRLLPFSLMMVAKWMSGYMVIFPALAPSMWYKTAGISLWPAVFQDKQPLANSHALSGEVSMALLFLTAEVLRKYRISPAWMSSSILIWQQTSLACFTSSIELKHPKARDYFFSRLCLSFPPCKCTEYSYPYHGRSIYHITWHTPLWHCWQTQNKPGVI